MGIPVTRGFKIASINLASLYKNIDQLRIYMLSKTVDILAINETRLDSSIQNGEVSIPGYTLERKDRNRNGGGVALYIRDSINYKRLIDLPDDNIELISIQVSKPKAKPFIVCTWYRPPGSTTELMNRFDRSHRYRNQRSLSGVCNKKDLYSQIKSKDCNEQML